MASTSNLMASLSNLLDGINFQLDAIKLESASRWRSFNRGWETTEKKHDWKMDNHE